MPTGRGALWAQDPEFTAKAGVTATTLNAELRTRTSARATFLFNFAPHITIGAVMVIRFLVKLCCVKKNFAFLALFFQNEITKMRQVFFLTFPQDRFRKVMLHIFWSLFFPIPFGFLSLIFLSVFLCNHNHA